MPLLSEPTELRSSKQPPNSSIASAPLVTERLLVVGGGMAGFGLCDRLVRKQAMAQFDVTIFGEEKSPAYDRVNLSTLFSGRTSEELQLANRQWYEDHCIHLHTGRRITQIDRARKRVGDDHGDWFDYDKLILATGSRAWVPPIPGANLPGVFVYRTIQDLQDIQRYVNEHRATIGTVIGGGLLGLEAAKVLNDLGLQVSVVEMAPGLMPRQLDSKAAALLKSKVEETGVDVHLVRRTHSIEREQGSDRLIIQFENSSPQRTDLLVIAAGVRPNDQLARDFGLDVGSRGGIVVDATLQTSDPNIFAIGECVCFRDHVYGLVAPCYRMADVLASRLTGDDEVFRGADESAELKLLGVQVATLGRAIGESAGGVTLTHKNEGGYRKILLEQGRIVGAACVGDWDELPQIRQAIAKQDRLWPWQRARFAKSGTPWSTTGLLPVIDWPDESVVCSCLNVTKGAIANLVASGTTEPEQIAQASGASTACGSCRVLVDQLAGRESKPMALPGATTMWVASLIAIAALVLWIWIPPIELATSVQSRWRDVDVLWRSDFARQVTGFTLLGVTAIGLVFSTRKRLAWFRWGSYGFWRSVHGVLGTITLFALAGHTGFRLGANLNWLLGVTFLLAGALGAATGVFSGLETKASGRRAMWLRTWRPRVAKWHLWVTWPLPVLIAIHIFSFYWFSD